MPAATPPIESRLAGLLALLLAACVNPVTTAYLLTADRRLDAAPLFYATWGLTILLALLSSRTLFRHDRLPLPLARTLVAVFSAALAFYLTIFLDRLAGRLFLPPAQHLVFPANTAVRFQTAEFDITAYTNHLGFRDREYPAAKGEKFRILVIGDSFTFGWGVPLADTWVKQLEAKVQAINPGAEVLNLGRSGAGPENYADMAARAIPVLQPDLVLVAVLQGNDLYQSLPQNDTATATPPLVPRQQLLQLALASAYPNFLRLLHQAGRRSEVQPVWQQQARALASKLAPAPKQRLQQLSPTVRRYFLDGQLNPDLVWTYLHAPDLYLKLEDVQHPSLQRGIRRMSHDLERIRAVASRHQAATWLVQVPNKYYLCENTMREHLLLGLQVDTALVHRNAPDSILAAEASRLALPLFPVRRFKKHCQTHKLYYTYDGHFTAAGNRLFAEALYAEIKEPLRQLRRSEK